MHMPPFHMSPSSEVQNNPLEHVLCNNLCTYYYQKSNQNIFFAMLLSLGCPCLQENMRRNLLYKVIGL